MRRDDDLIARTDPGGPERQHERRGARGHPDRVLHVAIRRELRLKGLDLLPEGECAGAEQAAEDCAQLFGERRVLTAEGDERDGRDGIGGYGSTSLMRVACAGR